MLGIIVDKKRQFFLKKIVVTGFHSKEGHCSSQQQSEELTNMNICLWPSCQIYP